MADTPKSPGRRLLRKSALQASPFGAPVKSFHSSSNSNNNSNNSTTLVSSLSPTTITTTSTTSTTTATPAPDLNPFEAKEPATLASPPTDSPTRRSARLDRMQQNNTMTNSNSNSNSNNNHNNTDTTSSLLSTPKKKKAAKLHPPTTPKSKTVVTSFVWGEVLGLSRQDGSVYYRYPINKSYCSFGRNNLNDIRIQIDGVSETHCKLIRRDDGEVWLKDTSTNGTLLNNILVHDTARPIQHHDIVTIGGRRFRFDTSEPVPRMPLQSTANTNTPGRQVRDIQATIDKDIQALAEAPSPTPGRLLSTPKKSLARSTAALESSLGLFTPNRAAKLSSLLVSPKPVPLPAFLAKSPRRPSTPKPVIAMIDEPSLFNSTPTATSPSSFTERQVSSSSGLHTPTKEKRKAPVDFDGVSRTPKKVSFGPALSPEIFDKSNPPSTPIKRGQQQDPETPRRQGLSTPSLLSKLSAAGSASKPILTPSRLSRTFLLANLERPAPPNLFAPENQTDAVMESSKGDEKEHITQIASLESTHDNDNDSRSLDDSSSVTAVNSKGDSSTDLWKQKAVLTNYDADQTALNSLAGIMDLSSEDGEQSPRPLGRVVDDDDEDDDNSPPSTPTRPPSGATPSQGVSGYRSLVDGFDDDDDDESPPATPTRGPSGKMSKLITSAPTRPKPLSPFMFQQENNHHEREAASPLKSDDDELLMTAQERNRSTPSPTMAESYPAYSEVNPFDHDSIGAAAIRLELSSPARSTIVADTTPVHTPIRRQTPRSNHDHDNLTSTPGSASRIALLQLSASKVRCLPDLLQSPSVSNSSNESAGSAPGTPSAVKLTLPIMNFSGDEEDEDDHNNHLPENQSTARNDEKAVKSEAEAEAEAKAEEEDEDEDGNQVRAHDAPMSREEEAGEETSLNNGGATPNLSWIGSKAPQNTDSNQGRRSSAPATAMRDSNESPFYTGLRGVFRTPQKVVESCFSGFVGFRNYVMSPSKPPGGLPLLLGADESTTEDLDDSAVEILGVQENDDGAIPPAAETDGLLTTNSLSPAQSLEQIRVRGRRSETLPRKRSVASPYRDQERSAKEKETRRRTYSLFDYHREEIKVSAPNSTAEPVETSETESPIAPADVEESQLPSENQVEQMLDGKEDAEQEELLRILGEGSSLIDENEDDSQKHDSAADEPEADDQLDFGTTEEDVQYENAHKFTAVPSRRTSSRRSSYGSRASTPIKRRQSFKQRLGSSSPAFRLYEQDQDEDDEEEDVVSMISPKRVRTTTLLG
ncbi:antigen identified by monoclonal antibody Ki-67 [Mortierella alpina]|nr:antigen identified by monoclonal antibody Ki-67 [Mortierella alpina]